MTAGSEWQPDRVQRVRWVMYLALVVAVVVFLIGALSVLASVAGEAPDWFLPTWGAVAVALSVLGGYAARATLRSLGTDPAKRWGITASAAVTLMGVLTLGAVWGFLVVLLGLVGLALTLVPNA